MYTVASEHNTKCVAFHYVHCPKYHNCNSLDVLLSRFWYGHRYCYATYAFSVCQFMLSIRPQACLSFQNMQLLGSLHSLTHTHTYYFAFSLYQL